MAIQSLQFRNGSVSLGDVFVSSWGYEQTNTCFYQVIALRGKKTAVLRRIAAQQVKANHEHPSVSIDEYEQAYKTDPNESHFYSTWG